MCSARRPLLTLVATGLIVGSCVGGGDATGVRFAEVELALQPALIPSPANGGALPIDRIRTVVLREPDGTLLREQRVDVSPTAAAWTVDVNVPVTDEEVEVVVYIYLLNVAGDGTESVQFSGRTDPLTVTVGTRLTNVDADIVRGPPENLLVTGVVITSAPDTLLVGQSGALTADVTGTEGADVFWTSLAPTVLGIADDDATGLAAGTANVVASAGAHADTVSVVVVVPPVDSVRVSPDSADVQVDQTRPYAAQLYDASGNPLTGRAVEWTTGNPLVATVDGSGVVTGVSAGTTTVRATSEGVFDEAVVRVTDVPVDSVRVLPDSTDVQVGSTQQYVASLFDAAGGPLVRPVTWTTANEAVATVDGSGVVSGVAVGTTTVRATSEGVFDEAVVRVTSAPGGGGGTNSWTANASGAWSNPDNWSLNRIPAAGDTVLIEQGGPYTVTLDVDATIARLVIGGTSAVVTLDVNGHTLNVTGTSFAPEIDIEPLGVLQMTSGSIFVEDLANRGMIQTTGSNGISVALLLHEGAIDVTGGVLNIFHPTGAILSSGDISVATGAYLAVLDNMEVQYSGGEVTGPGGILLGTGSGIELYADLTLNGAQLYIVSGAIDRVEGDRLTISQGATLFVDSSDGPSMLDVKVTVAGSMHLIDGSTTLTDSLRVEPTGYVLAGGATDMTAVTRDVENYGMISLAGAADVSFGPGDAGTIVNRLDGILQTASGGTSIIDGELLNQGYLQVLGATQLVREDGTDASVTAHHVSSGTLSVESDLTIVLGGSASTFTNTGLIEVGGNRTLAVSNQASPAGSIINDETGILRGNGTVDVRDGVPSGVNNGVIAPGTSPGALTWLGTIPSGPTGRIELEIDGPVPGTGHDQLNLSADLFQDGTLAVTASDFGTVDGDRFAVLTFRDRVFPSAFDLVELPTEIPGIAFDTLWTDHPGVDPDTLYIVASDASPAPPHLNRWINAAGGDWEVAANWSKNAVPVATDSVVIDLLDTYAVTLSSATTVGSLTIGRAGSQPSLQLTGTGHTLTVTGAVTNAGYIEFRDDATDQAEMALVAQGGLFNLPAGVVVAFGSGDVPRVVGVVSNAGTIWTQSQPLVIASPDVGAHTNLATGLIDAAGGNITFDLSQETTALDNYGRLLTRSGRSIAFVGGALNNLPGGRIEGLGELLFGDTSFQNDGVLDPGIGSTGILSIGGDATWGPSSIAYLELNGLTPGAHDQIVNTGVVTFAGTLVATMSGFTMQDGDRLAVMTFGQRALGSNFDEVILPIVSGLTIDTVWAESGRTVDTLYIEARATTGETLGEWGWMAGSSDPMQPGVYGELGLPAPENHPGSRYLGVTWTDARGDFWLFGGYGMDVDGTPGELNDLWRFSGEWTWMGGSQLANQPGSYGVLGEPNEGNAPGGRYSGVGWTDAEGNLWLFGGVGRDGRAETGYLNDLWRWDGVMWTWMSGRETVNAQGIAGAQGEPSVDFQPGARFGAVAWTDRDGNGWIFGGEGYDASDLSGPLNDLWRWDGSQWAWMEGDAVGVAHLAVYGELDVADDANKPGARSAAAGWSEVSGFWLFGGDGFDESSSGQLNDVWFYDTATGQWTWKDGSNGTDARGYYLGLGLNGTPGARSDATMVVGPAGYVYLFGGRGYGESLIGELSDIWRYDGVQWVWMGGENDPFGIGEYGALGEPAPGVRPGARYGAGAWPGPEGSSIWMFGGFGFADDAAEFGFLGDLWRYSPP